MLMIEPHELRSCHYCRIMHNVVIPVIPFAPSAFIANCSSQFYCPVKRIKILKTESTGATIIDSFGILLFPRSHYIYYSY